MVLHERLGRHGHRLAAGQRQLVLYVQLGGMATGWVYDNGTWYYMQSWGGMATGWQQIGSKWYYLYSNGAMAANTTIDGYVLGADGAMK